MLAPTGPVYQAGTLSGNPLAMTAGIETLKVLKQPGIYERLERLASALEQGIKDAIATSKNIKSVVLRMASLLTVFFTDNPVTDYASAASTDTALFAAFFRRLLSRGIYWPPSQFEAAFISIAHGKEDIQMTVDKISSALNSIKPQRNSVAAEQS